MKKLLLLILISGCVTNSDPNYTEYGFVITDDSGLQMGEWGNNVTPPQINGAELYQNYPNPFKSNTAIEFTLEVESNVDLWITSAGRSSRVATLIDDNLPAGVFQRFWDARSSGNETESGFYTVHLSVNSSSTFRHLYIGEPDHSRSEMIDYLESLEQ